MLPISMYLSGNWQGMAWWETALFVNVQLLENVSQFSSFPRLQWWLIGEERRGAHTKTRLSVKTKNDNKHTIIHTLHQAVNKQ